MTALDVLCAQLTRDHFCAVLTVFGLFLTVFDDWYTVGTLFVQSRETCDDLHTNGFECF